MTIRNKFAMYWAKDENWYFLNDKTHKIELTSIAPKEAIESFELWKKINNRT